MSISDLLAIALLFLTVCGLIGLERRVRKAVLLLTEIRDALGK